MRHTHISAEHKLFELKLKEAWQYRDLIILFARRSFKVVYKQTILGPLWLFINPLLTSIVYVILFGNIAKFSTEGVPQLLFYMLGNATWRFFSSCVSSNASTFTGNAHLFGKVYFPRITVPIASVICTAIQFFIQMLLVGALLAYYSIIGAVAPNWFLFPLILLVLFELAMLGMGFGIIISSLTTKYRDLSVLVGFGLELWMYATPVVYPLSTAEGIIKTVVSYNPVTAPMELMRYIVLGTGSVNATGLIYSAVFALAVMLFGIIVFNKVERTFMDTV